MDPISENFRKCVIIHLKVLYRKELHDIKSYEPTIISIEDRMNNLSHNKIDYCKNYLAMVKNKNFAELYINKRINIDKLLSNDINEKIRRNSKDEFTNLLMLHPYYKSKALIAENIAIDIENSCYNMTIEKSKNSDEIICRRWEDPLFVNIYEMRCHLIKNLLDMNSLSNKTYNIQLIDKIITNTIDPKNLGKLNEREICDLAFEDEINEINVRSMQKIAIKSSNIFQCPKCYEKNCIYNVQQISSPDESPHFMCECLNPNCRHRFIRRG